MQKQIPVAVYARVSTEHEEQLYALENQEEWFKNQLTLHPEWKLVETYIDRGITGTSVKKRKSFLRMIEDAKKGKFQMILTREVSRFARNIVDAISYTRELKTYGVGVMFLIDGINSLDSDGEFRLSLMSTFAQDESRKMSERVRAGISTSMERGVPLGSGNILGYDKVDGEFVINPEQAKTVRQIFDWALEGHGLRKITSLLEQGDYKTSAGNTNWWDSSVSRILDNKFYYGEVVYRKYVSDGYLNQKQRKNRGEEPYIIKQGKHVPIITKEEYDRVQALRAQRRKRTADNQKAHEKVYGVKPRTDCWTRLLVCGECGKPFRRNKWHQYADSGRIAYAYQCDTQKTRGSYKTRQKKGLSLEGICKTPYIPEWQLQMMTKHVLLQCTNSYDEVVSAAKNIIVKAVRYDKDKIGELSNSIKTMSARVDKLMIRKDKLFDKYLDEKITEDMFEKKNQQIDSEISDYKGKIEAMQTELETALSEDDGDFLIQNLKNQLDQMKDLINQDEIPESIIEAFIEKIIVYEDHFVFVLKYDSDIPLKKDGKTKKNFKITDFVPSLAGCCTGYNQQFEEIEPLFKFAIGKEEIADLDLNVFKGQRRYKRDQIFNIIISM